MCYILIFSKATKNKTDKGCAQCSEHSDAPFCRLTQAYLWDRRGSVFLSTFWNRSLCNANTVYDGQGCYRGLWRRKGGRYSGYLIHKLLLNYGGELSSFSKQYLVGNFLGYMQEELSSSSKSMVFGEVSFLKENYSCPGVFDFVLVLYQFYSSLN